MTAGQLEQVESTLVRKKVFLIVDTNIFLHFKPLKETDWLSVCNARQVVLVICSEVTGELDEHKYDARLRYRATSALKEVIEIKRGGGAIRSFVSLQLVLDSLDDESISAPFVKGNIDDRILLQARRLAMQESTDGEVAVYSNDATMQLKCEQHGILIIEPDEDTRLPDVKTESEKQQAKLAQELRDLRNRLPNLSVHLRPFGRNPDFPDPQPIIFYKLDAFSATKVMEAGQRAVPEYSKSKVSTMPTGIGSAYAWIGASPAEQQRYSRDRENYLRSLEVYCSNEIKRRDLLQRIFSFDLCVTNTGTAAATDVRIVINLPSEIDVVWIGSREFFKAIPPNPEPKVPRAPMSFAALAAANHEDIYGPHVNNPGLALRDFIRPKVPQIILRDDPSAEFIRTFKGSQIVLQLPRLVHHHEYTFADFYGVLKEGIEPHSFCAPLTITSADVPKKIDGSIHYIVNADSHAGVDEAELPNP